MKCLGFRTGLGVYCSFLMLHRGAGLGLASFRGFKDAKELWRHEIWKHVRI